MYGFGAQKTPESFKQACRRFIYTENLVPAAQPTGFNPPQSRSLESPSAAVALLTKAVSQMDSEDGWVNLGSVGKQLANLASDFDVRTYGFGKLSDLVRSTGAFDIDTAEGRNMRIRVKQKKEARAAQRAKS